VAIVVVVGLWRFFAWDGGNETLWTGLRCDVLSCDIICRATSLTFFFLI
jgi:hypothetical protein